MKNKRLYNIGMAAAIVVPLLFNSCSDSFLDVTPPDKATVDEYLYHCSSYIRGSYCRL